MDYLVSAPEMGELEQQTIHEYGLPGRSMMEIAGRAVATVCHGLLTGPSMVVIACGAGNNGGDGFVAARALVARGHRVSCYIFAERDRIRGDADLCLKTLEKTGEATLIWVKDPRFLLEFAAAVGTAHLLVDALIGTGLHDDVRGLLSEAIAVINDKNQSVVSVDIPSGVHADTGAIMGRAVRAQHTVTFGHAKRGHYLFPGAGLRGNLTVVDVGIPRTLPSHRNIVGRIVLPAHGPRLLRPRSDDSHKGLFGHAMIVAGSPQTPGAALLALRASLRAGAGLVSWATDEATLAHAPMRPDECMLRLPKNALPETWADEVLQGTTALVIGPGWATTDERGAKLRALLQRARVPLCLDADALNLIAQDPTLWELVRPDAVLTPHPKEMARLIQSTVQNVQKDRFAAAMQLAISRQCIVVLKGAGTVIADPDGTVAVVAAGNPGLATGGTGDVLAGLIGGLLSQRLDASTAARAGVLLHGMAGDVAAARHGQAGMRASDVIDAMGDVLAQWQR